MIKLDEQWYIDVDAYQYILYRKGKEYKDKGFAKLDSTFHKTLAQAIERYARNKEAEIVMHGDAEKTLDEAVAEVHQLSKHIKGLTEAVNRAYAART